MKLSPKKVRRIEKRARGRPAAEVARELGIPVEIVEEVLAKRGAGAGAPASMARELERALPWSVAVLVGLAPFAVIPWGQYNPSLLPQAVFVTAGSFGALLAWLVAGALRGRLGILRSPLSQLSKTARKTFSLQN